MFLKQTTVSEGIVKGMSYMSHYKSIQLVYIIYIYIYDTANKNTQTAKRHSKQSSVTRDANKNHIAKTETSRWDDFNNMATWDQLAPRSTRIYPIIWAKNNILWFSLGHVRNFTYWLDKTAGIAAGS